MRSIQSTGSSFAPRARLGLRLLTGAVAGLTVAGALFVGAGVSGCGGGGGGGGAAKPMVLIEFLFVDRSLRASFPTGVGALPRNAQMVFQFSELVDPSSINQQTIAIRYGAQFQSVPLGSFSVDGSKVIFDPTVTQQGTPNPFGFDPVTQYVVELPSAAIANDVVQNLDNDPLLTTFLSNFTTSADYLRELEPPTIDSIEFIPGQDPFTKQIKGDSIIVMHFSEPMDPATFVLGAGTAPTLTDTVDIRYRNLSPNPNANNPTGNLIGGVEGVSIPGTFTRDPSAKNYFFKPLFSFGSGLTNYDFAVTVFQGLTDLSGNALVNPRSFGPYVSDGTGIPVGVTLTEGFDNNVDKDTTAGKTTADWGVAVASELNGAAITTKLGIISGWRETVKTNKGQYNGVPDPLTGVKLNTYVTGINPPTSEGRRIMYAFNDAEVGQNGTITDIAWGPDSNATFAAKYPKIYLRLGYQKTNTISLATSMNGNYQGSPLVVYTGSYSVAQKKDVGNVEVPNPLTSPVGNFGCNQPVPTNGDLQCLFRFTGYASYPKLTSNFDWDEGDPLVSSDSVLLLDVSVQEGDTWQQIRNWYGVTAPNSGILINGYPTRRLISTYEQDDTNPQPSFTAGIVNPEPSISDTAFTLTKRVSLAQIRFYTPTVGGPGGPYPGGVEASAQTTLGTKSDYFPAVLSPSIQKGGASVLIEYFGCVGIQPSTGRTLPNLGLASTSWTTNINDCDRYPYIRWRVTLTANLLSGTVPKLGAVVIPIQLIVP